MNARRLAALLTLVIAAGASALAACTPIPGAPNCSLLPDNNVWHADISKLPVNVHSTAWLASSGANTVRLHPDFGSGGGVLYGIPYTTVAGNHPKVNVRFDYAGESDRVPYPLGPDTRIEPGSDAHAIVVDRDTCKLYETYATARSGNTWTAGSGAVYDLKSDLLRPDGYTSADAAGLPILPGLLRYDEVAAGKVDHAVRFTVSRSDRSHLWPARHDAGSANNINLPPMGARFRLKANYPLAGLRPDTVAVLTGFKKYGLIVADNGSNWYFTGAADSRWSNNMLDQLKRVPANAFEAIDESRLQASANSGQIR